MKGRIAVADEHWPQRVAVSAAGVVAAAHWRAAEAGAGVLAAGGNAIDAAVATAFTLGVCEPAASGLGGQTKMLVHLAAERRTFALDGSSRAPARTVPDALSRTQQLRGYLATTVPSTVAALGWALETYGTLPLAKVLEPAIETAIEGYPISALQRRLLEREIKHLRKTSAAPLLLDRGRLPAFGATFRQPILAGTLRRLADHGWRDFYLGEIADHIAADMAANGGLIGLDDLAQVPIPIERRPVASRFFGKRVLTFPPPGAGRTLLGILHCVAESTPKWRDLDTPLGAAALAEVIRHANQNRLDQPFDPNLFSQLDDKALLSAETAKRVVRQVRRRLRPQPTGETTHLSVMDASGNTVALTQSIERVFGSFEASPQLGFLYNNYMSAFEYEDITHPHYLRANAVPWATVAPTIVMRGGRPWLVLGSPGSERIASAIAQVLMRRESSSLMDAIAAPRLHCSTTGEVTLEASRMRGDIPEFLRRRGFTVRALEPFAFYLGCVQAVERTPNGFLGVADLRRDGAAVGV